MKILALESSATAASCALLEGEKLVGEQFLHTAQTHSQTLMPMAEALLALGGIPKEQLELVAVAAGPGSFTGLRIALAAAKGLAMALAIPCVGVSTLEALAYNLRGFAGTAAAVMDARRQQVYGALFALEGGGVARLTPDEALDIERLGAMLKDAKPPVFLVGDGAMLCYNYLLEEVPGLRLSPGHLRYQRASSVGALALEAARAGAAVPAEQLVPVYLRLPQAQRELNAREAEGPAEG